MSSAHLKQRVTRAAEAALERNSNASPIDILTGIGWLHPVNVEAWRKGRIGFLESELNIRRSKLTETISLFTGWATEKGLSPLETAYVRGTRDGAADLRFTESGDPAREKLYRTHWVPPGLPEPKKRKLEEKLAKVPDLTVFLVARNSECAECGVEIRKGDFLYLEADEALCLGCARMTDLEFLPSGDTALTRRSTKYTSRKAVVVEFSRSRGRYERKGILAEPDAIAKAEQECVSDAAGRARQRERAAGQRRRDDIRLVQNMTAAIASLFPACPPEQAQAIAAHAAVRGSGRVGRTASGQNLEEGALVAAVTAAVRHRLTNYDALLDKGVERADAREMVAAKIAGILASWRSR